MDASLPLHPVVSQFLASGVVPLWGSGLIAPTVLNLTVPGPDCWHNQPLLAEQPQGIGVSGFGEHPSNALLLLAGLDRGDFATGLANSLTKVETDDRGQKGCDDGQDAENAGVRIVRRPILHWQSAICTRTRRSGRSRVCQSRWCVIGLHREPDDDAKEHQEPQGQDDADGLMPPCSPSGMQPPPRFSRTYLTAILRPARGKRTADCTRRGAPHSPQGHNTATSPTSGLSGAHDALSAYSTSGGPCARAPSRPQPSCC